MIVINKDGKYGWITDNTILGRNWMELHHHNESGAAIIVRDIVDSKYTRYYLIDDVYQYYETYINNAWICGR